MQFVKNLKNYKTKCNRVRGLQKLIRANLQTPKALQVLTHQAFIEYTRCGMSEQLSKEIESAFLLCIKKDPKRPVYIGRAFFVPENKNPAGLRFSVNSVKKAIKAVVDHYEYVIKQKYDKAGAEIGIIFHPWINPKIPFGGGCIVLKHNQQKQIVIETIYGLDEGIQSFPHDIYYVDYKKEKIIKKSINHKTGCLHVNSKIEVERVRIPKKYTNAQVLNNNLILKTAKDFKRFLQKYPPHRIEFVFQPEGIYYRECVPFVLRKEITKKVNISSQLLVITNERSNYKNTKMKIIFIDPITIQQRKMNLLTDVACKLKSKKIILFPGNASTAHIATVFREAGHTVVLVGDQIYKTGDNVKVINSSKGYQILK